MPNPWESAPQEHRVSQPVQPWESVPEDKRIDAPQHDRGFHPAIGPKGENYGFMVRDTVLPNGSPTIEREDGAVYIKESNDPRFKGQEGWNLKDKETGIYVPAPSRPWDRMGAMGQIKEAAAFDARNLKAGWDSAMGGLTDLGARVGNSLGLVSDETKAQTIRRLVEGARYKKALGNAGGMQAKALQLTGEVAPVVAATALGTPAVAAALPASLAPIAAPVTLGLATAASTQGDAQERAQAGELAATAEPLGAVVVKGIGKIPGGLRHLGRKIAEYGDTPAVNDFLDSLGAKLGGKSPGVALQDAANSVYDKAWQRFMAKVAPLDEAAVAAKVDYAPAVQKGREILGIGVDREPGSLTEEGEKIIRRFYTDMDMAGKPNSGVSSSFKGGMNLVKRLSAAERQLAQKHGDLEARDAIAAMKESVLDSMERSNPNLTSQFKEGRKMFKDEVAPLFSKGEGGDLLTKIRDTPRPNDVLAQFNQGSLTRMKSDALNIVAKGSSADPLLYSILDAAITQSAGKPGSFVTSLGKAMPAVERIADSETKAAFQGMLKVAKTSKFAGFIANVAGGAVAGGGPGAVLGAAATISPKFTGPGLIWNLMQAPTTRRLLRIAGKMPEGSHQIEVIANEISKLSALYTKGFSSQQSQQLMPVTASTENQDPLKNAYKLP